MDAVVSKVGGWGWIGGAVLLLLVAEAVVAQLRGRRIYNPRDTFCSLAVGAGSILSSWLSASVVLALVAAAWEHRVADLGRGGWAYGAAFLAVDFIYYWGHRFSHHERWLWAAHRTHHSSRCFNLSTALRQSWTPWFLGAGLLGLPAIWLGLRPDLLFSMYALSHAYQFFLHTELVGSLGPLEWVLNTPSHHRVHHATSPCYLDRNFGGVLIVWDRLFGTFAAERADAPVSFGLVGGQETFNPLWIIAEEYLSMLRDASRWLEHRVQLTTHAPERAGWPRATERNADQTRLAWGKEWPRATERMPTELAWCGGSSRDEDRGAPAPLMAAGAPRQGGRSNQNE